MDDADYESVSRCRWLVFHHHNDMEYAMTTRRDGKRIARTTMHRLILGLTNDDPRQVRHVNTSGLDNRRANLEIVLPGRAPGESAISKPALLRTWDAFVEHAYDLFGRLADQLPYHMGRHRLTQNQIMFYVNWTFGMTHQEIADHFEMTRNGVTKALQRLRNRWPDLFLFPPREDPLSYDPERHDPFVVRDF